MYDIVLWGATGHAGRQATIYLHNQYGKTNKIKWAIAGRNQSKLEKLKQELNSPDLDILIVPGCDKDIALKTAQSTKVVCSAIAPSARLASEMVEACAETGTDFCDLSGELHWLRAMIDQHHDTAVANGARIINACGFDSIPSDLGVQLLQETAFEQYGEYCHRIKNRFVEGNIAVSGGSYESGKGVLDAVKNDPALDQILANPHCLNPANTINLPAAPELDRVIFDKDFDQWIMPFPLGGINTRIVRRSNALLDFRYGKDFQYDEAQLAGKGFINKIKGQLISKMTQLFIEGDPNTLIVKMMHQFAPKPGTGPSDEFIQKAGPFSFSMVGVTPSNHKLKGYVYSDWDPGHGGTAAMLCETALCLAFDKDKTPKTSGFTTTSVALGKTLRERLANNANIEIKIGDLNSRTKANQTKLNNQAA